MHAVYKLVYANVSDTQCFSGGKFC